MNTTESLAIARAELQETIKKAYQADDIYSTALRVVYSDRATHYRYRPHLQHASIAEYRDRFIEAGKAECRAWAAVWKLQRIERREQCVADISPPPPE